MKIGIGYTVHNRNEIAATNIATCITNVKSTLTKDKFHFAIVDDASETPFFSSDYRFKENVGIATAKNKCIELLYNEGCTHLFLFDDDTYPVLLNWWQPYIHSGLNHACWNFNRQWVCYGILAETAVYTFPVVERLKEYVEYEKPNGCMLYATRKVIDTVGGWDTDFKGYGYDHVNWSDRIFNNSLTPARYIDIPNSSHLFKMADCETSVSYAIRASTIPINEKLYQQKFYSKEFKPFK